MSAEDLNLWLSGENSLYAHLAVFISLLLGGVGFPIPEDIPLLLSGLAASKGVVSLKSIFGTCYVGVVLADQIVYALGYYFCLLYTSPSPRDATLSRMPSSA